LYWSGSESGSAENGPDSEVINYGSDDGTSSQGVFDEGDRVALDEMLLDLGGMMGPEGDVELWRLREYLCSGRTLESLTILLQQGTISSVIVIVTMFARSSSKCSAISLVGH
jgi:hypothetical protein